MKMDARVALSRHLRAEGTQRLDHLDGLRVMAQLWILASENLFIGWKPLWMRRSLTVPSFFASCVLPSPDPCKSMQAGCRCQPLHCTLWVLHPLGLFPENEVMFGPERLPRSSCPPCDSISLSL
jgi:hypothetical protein